MSDCGDVKKVFVPTKSDSSSDEERIIGIRISDIAAEKIVTFLKNENKDPEEYGLWVSVTKDGCSGHSYIMELRDLATSIENKDKIFEHNGAHLMVEKSSYFYVTGSILDYTEALTGSGFSLTNPNIKKTCSCGSSFSV